MIRIANKHHVYSPLEGTINVYINYMYMYIHTHIDSLYNKTDKSKHQPVLSSLRQETLNGVSS